MSFDRHEHNAEHLTQHAVGPEEAEEAMLDPRRIAAPAYSVGEERRWALLGATEAGRALLVVFTRRGRSWRVITARDATPVERRRYGDENRPPNRRYADRR